MNQEYINEFIKQQFNTFYFEIIMNSNTNYVVELNNFSFNPQTFVGNNNIITNNEPMLYSYKNGFVSNSSYVIDVNISLNNSSTEIDIVSSCNKMITVEWKITNNNIIDENIYVAYKVNNDGYYVVNILDQHNAITNIRTDQFNSTSNHILQIKSNGNVFITGTINIHNL